MAAIASLSLRVRRFRLLKEACSPWLLPRDHPRRSDGRRAVHQAQRRGVAHPARPGRPLASALDGESVKIPLALADPPCAPGRGLGPGRARSARRVSEGARRQLQGVWGVRQGAPTARPGARRRSTAAARDQRTPDLLEDHLVKTRLENKRQRLQVMDKYLKLLGQKPAASASLPNPGGHVKDAASLPEVPMAVVDGLATDMAADGKTDLKTPDWQAGAVGPAREAAAPPGRGPS